MLEFATFCIIVLLVPHAAATEPAASFLKTLRERGYTDTALEYLDAMKTSRLAPAGLKESWQYEVGSTLSIAATKQPDAVLREQQLDQARDAFQQFLSEHPRHLLAAAAQSELGNLLVLRGQLKLDLARKSGDDAPALQVEARKFYDEAYQVLVKSQTDLKDRVDKLRTIDPDDRAQATQREQLQFAYQKALLMAAAIKEETADTVAKGTEEHRQLLTAAAEQYGAICEKYRARVIGFYARMFQGRCFQKLDRFLEALSSYTEVLDQPDLSGEFRKLKAEVFVLAAECWSRSTPPLHAEAVNRLAPFVASARPKEDKQPQWLKLRLELAKAQWRRAQDLKQIDAKDSQVKQLEAEARRHFVFVAKEPGELQPQARELLAQAGGTPGAKPDAPSQPTTFGDANRAGREALEAMQTANLILDAVPERLAKEQDLDDVTRADLQKQLQEAQQKSATAIQDAKRHFRQALALAGREAKVEPDELAAIRYYLCYLYYASGEYEEAGLLGDFLARRSPSSPLAPEGAKIALHCFVKLYAENKSEDKSFESKRLTDIASYITQKWPDRPEAIDALNTLIPFVVRDGRLEQAEQYLNAIPPESSKRGDAEIKTGQALWSAYLKGVQEVRGWEADKSTLPEGVDLAAKKQTLEELKTKAQKVLVDGIARMQRGESVSTTLATAALSLAQIYVDTQQIDKAVALLEDEKLGPLPLVKAQHPAADREGFKAEAYKTALRAYLSSLAGAAAPEAVVQKATEVMEALKDSLEEDKLIALYVSLARELEAEMKLATPEAKVTLSQAFEKFLRQIQTGGRAFSVLNWVAETFAGMAESFDTDKANLTDEARQYYTEAAKTYQAILDKVQFGDPRQKTAVRLRQAFVARRLEVFTEAKKTYLEILRANPQTVNVQVEAARMYQEWARFPEKEALYEWAIRGAEPDPKSGRNIIWGWAHLGNQVAPYPKFRDTFFEARYNLSWCRYQWGLGQAKSEQKAFFEKAKQDILRTQQLYGTGREWEAWKPRFDSLLKMLQRQLGEQPVGLPSSSLGAK